MNITSITFNNFRCFGEYHLQFKPTVNLLFGVNGCGKTSILRGLKIAMSSFFSGFSDSNTRFIGISNDDFMSEVRDGVESLERQVNISYDLAEFKNMILSRTGKKIVLQFLVSSLCVIILIRYIMIFQQKMMGV